MQLNIYSNEKQIVGSIDIADTIFGKAFNEPLVHQVYIAYLAKRRQGTHAQKTRAEVRGGGSKPWKQKGTGRARSGTITSPIWRKGGVTFAAKTQSYEQKVNRKMYRGAIMSIFSEFIRQDRLITVDNIHLNSPKTKEFIEKFKDYDLVNRKQFFVFITDNDEANLHLAARNLPNIVIMNTKALNLDYILRASYILVTQEALKNLEGKFL